MTFLLNFFANLNSAVDDPQDPPCLRCRREHKECVFSETRRKRKPSDGEDESAEGTFKRRLTAPPDEVTRDLLTNHAYTVSPSYPATTPSPHQWASQPHQPGATSQPVFQQPKLRHLPAYGNPAPADNSRSNGHMLNKAAADALNPAIATSYDALYLLSQAAGQTGEAGLQNQQNGARGLQSPSTTFGSPGSTNPSHHRTVSNTMTPSNMIDPAMVIDNVQADAEYKNAFRAWARMRFVRAGWFTAYEAMDYID